MFELTKSFTFTLLSSLVVGAFAFGYLSSGERPPSEDGLNEYPMSATEYLLQREMDKDPATKAMVEAMETPYLNYMNSPVVDGPETVLADFTLPVVVHIIHQNGAENINNAQVASAIDHLNDAFENVGYYDQGTGVNTQIEFCLAKTNPQGDPSTGVTRVEDALTDVTIESEDLALKDLDRWDPNQYINIWVVRSIASDAFVNTIRGYSYLPAFHGTDRDGIVIEAEFFGSSEESSTAIVREMGHYLGLYSTFHAGCGNDDCLQDGDRVCDTPPDWTIAEAPCEVTENSCFTDVNLADPNNPFTQDENDMRENYMDINPLACYSAFTQGQTDRMTFFINNDRMSLLNNTISCTNDCDSPIEDLAIDPGNDTTIVINNQALFTATATNASTFTWTLNGVQIGTGSNLVYNFDSAGVFTLTVTAGNADIDCDIEASLQVTVIDCFGNTWVDDGTGEDVFMCGQPGSPCKTIQYALDNSVCSGDTIFIRSGTYSLPLATPITTPIVQIPEDFTVTFFGVENSGPVMIDGGGIRRGFVYDYAGSPCPPSQPDNGVNIAHQINFANITIQNCRSEDQPCTNGDSWSSGGAIHAVNAIGSTLDISINNCQIFDNNSADNDVNNANVPVFGVVYFDGKVDDLVADSTSASMTVTNSEFSENRATQTANGGVGGALSLFYLTSVQVSDSYFCSNKVEGLLSDDGDLAFDRNSGGAIAIFDRSNLLPPNNHKHTIENSYFLNNEAIALTGIALPNSSKGGALFFGGDLYDMGATSTATLNINFSSFYNNNIETGIEHFSSGAGSLVLNGNTISNDPYVFDLGNDTTICNTDSITIGTELVGAAYVWSTGDSTATITVGDTGVYILTISMGACEFIDSIEISEIICGEICGNGIDDDGDGLIDCFDPECCGQEGCDLAWYNECADACSFSNSDNDIQAEIKWQSNVNVSFMHTPITGDIDGDGTPEIIIPEKSILNSRIRILDGLTGAQKFEIVVPTEDSNGDLAIADVDKDGTAEIFYADNANIYRFEHDGTQTASFALGGGGALWTESIGVADFDQDGTPEVYANNSILSAADLSVLVTIPIGALDANLPVAVDVLDDGACPNCEGLELVMGNTVYSINISSGTSVPTVQVNLNSGPVSIADIDKDGDLDAIVSEFLPGFPTPNNAIVYAWDLQTNTIIGQYDPSENPGPTAVADIDGDGQLEIVFKTGAEIVTLENDFTLKWTVPSAEDDTNVTRPVAFDFDGDGDFEIISRGSEQLEIFDGTDGTLLFSDGNLSNTSTETPVIVDVDGDGLTEILVSGAGSPANLDNDNGFVRAYTSSTFPWQTTRSVWNQHSFFGVNIEDNLSTPTVQQQHHIVGDSVVLNNFLAQHGEQLGADAFIASVDILCALDELIVTVEVCNSGQSPLSHTTEITFYGSDPTAGPATFLDTEVIGVIVPVDSCRFIEFTIPAQYDDPIFAVINDDNTGVTPFDLNTDFPVTNIGECDYSNNIFQFTEMPEPFELDLGDAFVICDNSSIELNASSHFVSYEWQDGTTDSTFTAWDGGMYWVTVIDSCGGMQTDTVQLIVDPPTLNMTEPAEAIVCPTQDTSFTVVGNFDTYVWLPNDFLDCDTCQTVNVMDPDMDVQYIVTASNSLTGCYSVDTVLLTMAGPINTADFIQTCIGETVVIHGNMVSDPGTYSETFTSILGCDSISTITLTNFAPLTLNFQSTPTCPQGSEGTVSVFVSNGMATEYEWSISGVGNSPTADNLPAGTYTVTVTDTNNCTTIGSVEVQEENTLPISTDFIPPSCPGASDGVLEILNPQAGFTYSINGTDFQASPIFMNLPAGAYQISVQDGDCLFSDIATGNVIDPAGIDILGFPNEFEFTTFPDSFDINVGFVSANPISSIQWSPATGLSCDDCSLLSALPLQDSTTYTMVVTDSEGCTAQLSFTLIVALDCRVDEVEIPNAFTPNGDEVNDDFSAYTDERIEEVLSMRIYNRWGNLIYEANDGTPWDGNDGDKAAPMDVYIYVMEIGCSAGGLEQRAVRSGDVTLIR